MQKIHILTDKKLERIIARRIEENKTRLNIELQREVMNNQMSLASLQSQINPHFLYNALEGIRGQALLDNAPVIVDIAQALANYFRYSISSKSDIATLQEELSNVNNYLKIQQFRFNNRFIIEINYDKEDRDILDVTLPKLTLQPIIENAICHGFEKKIGQAKINIDIEATKRSVNITISDNGMGMDEKTLYELNKSIVNYDVSQSPIGRHNGIAMPNINRRLQLMFGEEYGIHISSIKDIGTDVDLHIPFCIKG